MTQICFEAINFIMLYMTPTFCRMLNFCKSQRKPEVTENMALRQWIQGRAVVAGAKFFNDLEHPGMNDLNCSSLNTSTMVEENFGS